MDIFIFGENKVQEASLKFDKFIADNYSDTKLHLIGPLQSNKAKLAASTFDVIQSIDRKKIIDIIEDVKSNLSVDVSRVHLTGLSMGGRGSFIVASEYPDVFASIMPLSPHHTPYNYLSLKDKVKNNS